VTAALGVRARYQNAVVVMVVEIRDGDEARDKLERRKNGEEIKNPRAALAGAVRRLTNRPI
jgi:hypothetical protein